MSMIRNNFHNVLLIREKLTRIKPIALFLGLKRVIIDPNRLFVFRHLLKTRRLKYLEFGFAIAPPSSHLVHCLASIFMNGLKISNERYDSFNFDSPHHAGDEVMSDSYATAHAMPCHAVVFAIVLYFYVIFKRAAL